MEEARLISQLGIYIIIFANISKGTAFLLQGLSNDSKNGTKTSIGSEAA